jgi:hypothetical protein
MFVSICERAIVMAAIPKINEAVPENLLTALLNWGINVATFLQKRTRQKAIEINFAGHEVPPNSKTPRIQNRFHEAHDLEGL